MCFKKRAAAAILAVSLVLSTGAAAFGAGSPTQGNTPTSESTKPTEAQTPTAGKYIDKNTGDHKAKMVTSTVTSKAVTAYKVSKTGSDTGVVFKVARNAKGKAVYITAIGNGKSGVFNSKAGRKVDHAKISSKKTVTINANAFKGSKVKKLQITSKVKIKKNAFKGTKVANPTITISAKKAKNVAVAKGAFTGLNKKAKIVVKGMSAKEFKSLKKKLQKANFKGKISRA